MLGGGDQWNPNPWDDIMWYIIGRMIAAGVAQLDYTGSGCGGADIA